MHAYVHTCVPLWVHMQTDTRADMRIYLMQNLASMQLRADSVYADAMQLRADSVYADAYVWLV
jgi:hypothetical protein